MSTGCSSGGTSILTVFSSFNAHGWPVLVSSKESSIMSPSPPRTTGMLSTGGIDVRPGDFLLFVLVLPFPRCGFVFRVRWPTIRRGTHSTRCSSTSRRRVQFRVPKNVSGRPASSKDHHDRFNDRRDNMNGPRHNTRSHRGVQRADQGSSFRGSVLLTHAREAKTRGVILVRTIRYHGTNGMS